MREHNVRFKSLKEIEKAGSAVNIIMKSEIARNLDTIYSAHLDPVSRIHNLTGQHYDWYIIYHSGHNPQCSRYSWREDWLEFL